jgi:hypothetical protein
MAVLQRSTASLETREPSPGREGLTIVAVPFVLLVLLAPVLTFGGGAWLAYLTHH